MIDPEEHLLVWLQVPAGPAGPDDVVVQAPAPPSPPAPPAPPSPPRQGWTEFAERLRLEMVPQAGFALLRVEGALDSRTLGPLAGALDRARREAGPGIVVDLSLSHPGSVEWVSAVNEARGPVEAAGGRLVLLAPPSIARSHLELLGLQDLFPVALSVDDAAALLR